MPPFTRRPRMTALTNKERELDELFLSTKSETTDGERISNLKDYVDAIPRITPYLDLIREETENIRKIFTVYDIQLGILSKDLEDIQGRSSHLKAKAAHEEALYNSLKELCMALALDDEHIQILESASFTDAEDMAKVERALSVLNQADLRKYKIRVAQEKVSETLEGQRSFLKRFALFLSKIFVRSESIGELCIHRDLYDMMRRYKSVFLFSKRFHDYAVLLTSAYVSHAKNLYEDEFQNHLSTISSLANTPDKVTTCIEVLLKSFDSLVDCEAKFMRLMEFECEVSEIFKNVMALIFNFLQEMARKSRITTIISLRAYLSNKRTESPCLKDFKAEVERYCDMFEEHFTKLESDHPVTSESVEFVNHIRGQDEVASFRERIVSMYIEKLMAGLENLDVVEMLKRHSLFNTIESVGSEKKEALGHFNEILSKKIIGTVFESSDVFESTEDLIRDVDPTLTGSNETLRFVREVVLKYAEESDRQGLQRVFSNFKPGSRV